jgi:hypothetical protein
LVRGAADRPGAVATLSGVICLFSGKFLVRILLSLTVICLASACRQAPEEDEGFNLQTPGAATSTPIDAAAVVEHLKASNQPIGRTDVYNAETDPVSRLGRPNQYVGKAIFHDTRLPLVLQQGQDVISFQNSGGIVEIFADAGDLKARIESLELARKQFPAAFPEYQYSKGLILIRLGHVLTPEQAAGYEAALASFQS